jgi:hypothetical protein
MKQQFNVTHWHAVLQETEKHNRSLVDQHLGVLCIYDNRSTNSFCGHNILTEDARVFWRWFIAVVLINHTFILQSAITHNITVQLS